MVNFLTFHLLTIASFEIGVPSILFFANSYFILQISHAKTSKMKYTRCPYNNIIQKYSLSHKDRLCVVQIFMNQTLYIYSFSVSLSFEDGQLYDCCMNTPIKANVPINFITCKFILQIPVIRSTYIEARKPFDVLPFDLYNIKGSKFSLFETENEWQKTELHCC